MPAKIISGVAVAAAIRAEIKVRVSALKGAGIEPGLAVILVDSDAASAGYARNKIRACNEVGIQSFRYDFPALLHSRHSFLAGSR
jgi:methylenetetrahydrofolate dehydrogenase (NADP+) / methenyltetrahydrofolate cyclohydrolase